MDEAAKAVAEILARGWGYKICTDQSGAVEAVIFEQEGGKQKKRIGYAVGKPPMSLAAVLRLAIARAVKANGRVELTVIDHRRI